MLRMIGISPVLKSELSIDLDVPLHFQSYDGLLPDSYRWRIGNFRTSLFELQIEQWTGIVRGATLILTGSKTLAAFQDEHGIVPQKLGLPIVDTSIWMKEDICDESYDFSFIYRENVIYVVFDSYWNPSSCIVNDRIAFFEQKGEICGVGFLNLTQEEKIFLKRNHFTHGI